MWLLTVKGSLKTGIIVLVATLAGCPTVEGPEQQKYQAFMQLPDSEKAVRFNQLSPQQQVDLYLYSVENLRPGDHFLARYFELTDEKVVNAIVERMRSSESPRGTFGLVYALHVISKIKDAQRSDARAMEACDRFYTKPSPCHQLAEDIDAGHPTVQSNMN